MDKEKYWLKFIITGKPEDYLKYTSAKLLENKAVGEYSLFNGGAGNRPEQYR